MVHAGSARLWRGLARCVATTFAVSFALGCVGIAWATTSPGALSTRPHFHVSPAAVAPYLGRFTLGEAAGPALLSGAYVSHYNEFGYPEGSLVIYVDGQDGSPETWVATTYDYHLVKGRMVIDLISPNNQVVFGRMTLRSLRDGELAGQLEQLRPPGRSQPITLVPAS